MNASNEITGALDDRLDQLEDRLPALPASLVSLQRALVIASLRTACSGVELLVGAVR